MNRDRAAMLRVEQVQQAYQQLLAKQPKSKPISDEVAEIRYMIEELRVSLFAAAIRNEVSGCRIRGFWELLIIRGFDMKVTELTLKEIAGIKSANIRV